MSEPPADPDTALDGTLVLRVVIGLVVVFLLAGSLAFLFGDELRRLGGWATEAFGWGFVFAGVFCVDLSPVPLVNEPVLLLALSGGLDVVEVGAAAVAASLLAAWCGYGCGYLLARRGSSARLLGKHAERGERFVRRYGFWGVALAALTPLPFGLCTWTAGALRMPLLSFFAASLFRAPKAAFYLWVVWKAWTLGAR